MTSVSWYAQGVIHIDYQEKPVNSDYNMDLLVLIKQEISHKNIDILQTMHRAISQ